MIHGVVQDHDSDLQLCQCPEPTSHRHGGLAVHGDFGNCQSLRLKRAKFSPSITLSAWLYGGTRCCQLHCTRFVVLSVADMSLSRACAPSQGRKFEFVAWTSSGQVQYRYKCPKSDCDFHGQAVLTTPVAYTTTTYKCKSSQCKAGRKCERVNGSLLKQLARDAEAEPWLSRESPARARKIPAGLRKQHAAIPAPSSPPATKKRRTVDPQTPEQVRALAGLGAT